MTWREDFYEDVKQWILNDSYYSKKHPDVVKVFNVEDVMVSYDYYSSDKNIEINIYYVNSLGEINVITFPTGQTLSEFMEIV
jgi:hypothetical protein